jgi:hypothetical protein
VQTFIFYSFSLSSFDPFVKKRSSEDAPRDKQEVSKLLHKMKREKKGAKKAIRADAAFLATQKAKDARERYDYSSFFLSFIHPFIYLSLGTLNASSRPRRSWQGWETRREIAESCRGRRND